MCQQCRRLVHHGTQQVCGCPAAVPARRQLQRADKTYSDDHDAVVQEAKANEGQRVVQQHCGTETNKQMKAAADLQT